MAKSFTVFRKGGKVTGYISTSSGGKVTTSGSGGGGAVAAARGAGGSGSKQTVKVGKSSKGYDAIGLKPGIYKGRVGTTAADISDSSRGRIYSAREETPFRQKVAETLFEKTGSKTRYSGGSLLVDTPKGEFLTLKDGLTFGETGSRTAKFDTTLTRRNIPQDQFLVQKPQQPKKKGSEQEQTFRQRVAQGLFQKTGSKTRYSGGSLLVDTPRGEFLTLKDGLTFGETGSRTAKFDTTLTRRNIPQDQFLVQKPKKKKKLTLEEKRMLQYRSIGTQDSMFTPLSKKGAKFIESPKFQKDVTKPIGEAAKTFLIPVKFADDTAKSIFRKGLSLVKNSKHFQKC